MSALFVLLLIATLALLGGAIGLFVLALGAVVNLTILALKWSE